MGVDAGQLQALENLSDPGLELFRVAVEAQAQIALVDFERRVWGELSGRLRAEQSEDPLARPAVGDFVAARAPSEGGYWRIEHVLPRRTQFVRQSAKRRGDPQLVAANLDLVLVVTSPNEEFNPRRIERYLATIHASGAEPGVVLNKTDLVADSGAHLERLREVALDAPVLPTSAADGRGIEALRRQVGDGRTVALVGSSGVGKSSLTNALLGDARQATAEIREEDAKGRHTTTHRELFFLPHQNGLLVDTPGMRALSLWVDPEALDEAFADVASIAEGCRFRDCSHRVEPGCAVRDAMDRGELSRSRVASYLRLRAEVAAAPIRRRGRPRLRSR